METYATGYRRIKEESDESGCEVGFEKQENGFVVIFYRNLREEWKREAEENSDYNKKFASLGVDTQRTPREHPDKNFDIV